MNNKKGELSPFFYLYSLRSSDVSQEEISHFMFCACLFDEHIDRFN